MKAIPHILSLILSLTLTLTASAQVATPKKGGNQKAQVCQWMGEVKICVTYNSPDVSLPSGKSRRGEIWGKLIPYGLYTQQWLEKEGEAPQPKPWRAGADENTAISISHDILVQDQLVKAGTYGIFFNVGEDEWELILSSDSDSWGAYFYNPANDVIRVKLKPEKAPYREYLTYDFTTRKAGESTLSLWWEDLMVPINLKVNDVHDVYLSQFKKDLASKKMMYWYNWQEAAKYCLDNTIELEQGLEWIEKAINQGWIGEANFTTLRTKSELLAAVGREKESSELIDFAVEHTAGMYELHNYSRELIANNQTDRGLELMKLNANKHPNQWVTQLGLARGYAANNDSKNALKYAKKAKSLIPDNETGARKFAVQLLIDQLNKGEKPIVYLSPGWVQVY